MNAFRVGQKVVCVNTAPIGGNLGDLHGLTKGVVYTIREVGIDPWWDIPALWLVEIYRPVYPGYEDTGEVGYDISRFRPLAYPSQSIEHDVAKFQNIGTHVRTPEKERA